MKYKASFFASALAGLLLLGFASFAQAQWSWKDKDGRRVFSDQPPPPSVPEKDIVKRPAGAKAPEAQGSPAAANAETPAGNAAAATATAGAAPKISGKDPELEKKKKEAESKEAGAKKAEAEKTAAARKENCERAKRAKAGFDSGTRISTTNAKGEREFMNETARAAEAKRLQDIISSDCS